MQLRFFGHAAIGLHSDHDGQRILLDPYEPGGFGGQIAYPPIDFQPDLICLTHQHLDHSHTTPWPNTTIFGPKTFASWPNHTHPTLKIRTLRVAHDAFEGTLRGGHSWCILLEMDNLRILHLGDIGECPPQHRLDQLTQNKPIDVLLTTCGGYFTIGPDQAAELATRLRARLIIPIHYRTEACTLPHLINLDVMKARFKKHLRHEGALILTQENLPDAGTLLELVPIGV